MSMPLSIHDALNDRQIDKIKLSIYMIARIYAKVYDRIPGNKKVTLFGQQAIYPICKFMYKLSDLLAIPNKHGML